MYDPGGSALLSVGVAFDKLRQSQTVDASDIACPLASLQARRAQRTPPQSTAG